MIAPDKPNILEKRSCRTFENNQRFATFASAWTI
jgi:hypothetical protein